MGIRRSSSVDVVFAVLDVLGGGPSLARAVLLGLAGFVVGTVDVSDGEERVLDGSGTRARYTAQTQRR